MLLAALALVTASAADLDPGTVAVYVSGTRALVEATPSVGALSAFDTDGDGQLSQDEIDAHEDVVQAEVIANLRLLDGAGTEAHVDFILVEPAGDHVRVVMQASWATAPRRVSVDYGLFAAEEPVKLLSRSATDAGTGWTQTAWLRPGARSAVLTRS